MKRGMLWLGLMALLPLPAARAEERDVKIVAISDTAHPGMRGWKVAYTKPGGLSEVKIKLLYKFWDLRIDGDFPSRKQLNQAAYPKASAQVSFSLFINAKESLLILANGTITHGKGFPLDAGFTLAQEPQRNADGVYVLAQKPADPKHPAALGNTMEALYGSSFPWGLRLPQGRTSSIRTVAFRCSDKKTFILPIA